MKLNINKPCPENWEKMKIGLHSRFCDNCQKNVIDFTNKNRREILEYLLTNRNERVCGRIYRSQLDFSDTDLLVTIQALSQQHKNSNLPFYLLTVGAMILASCNNPTPDEQNTSQPTTQIIQHDTVTAYQSESNDTLEKNNKKDSSTSIIPEEIVMGDIVPYPDTIKTTGPYSIVDKMPEFKGGIDSLMSYIKRNLQYPAWEKENKIEGKVFVSFIVDHNGKIKDAEIIHSVGGSKNFGKEVLRIINNMPNWVPGQQDGKNVDVRYTLPINFEL